MSVSFWWLLGAFTIQGIVATIVFVWTVRRIRVSRPITRRQHITIVAVLVAVLIATWIVTFIS